jgi:predicted amidohydrolase YtcJ
MNNLSIIYNAKIYTMDKDQPNASAIIINTLNGRILAVGRDDKLLSEFEGKGERYDAHGQAIIPGLTDAHIHLEQFSLGLQKINCETATRKQCLHRVEETVQNTPRGKWILGHGWNQNNWSEGFGDVALLDEVAPKNPAYLTAKSLHAAWVNSQALQQAGITDQTPDPSGGRIGRYQDGYPNGILYESAMQLVKEIIPEPSLETIVRAIGDTQETFWRIGITGVHDFDRQRCFSALQILQNRGELKLRVLKSIPLEGLPHAVELGLRSGFGDDYLRVGSIKIFADGALGPRTAAMMNPYENEPENRGILMMDAEELYEHGSLAVQNGFSLAVHAIGDLANHEVLNAYQQLQTLSTDDEQVSPTKSLRHRIEHIQLIHPDDAGRLARLGIVASMQPIHATSDMDMADRYWGERAAFAYAWREQLEQGSHLAFGSDAPVESPNPFFGLHAAVTRRREDGIPGANGWYPGQRLSLEQSMRAYTIGPAYAAGMENRLGKLSPGYHADLLILDEDPFNCDPDYLRTIQPSATMIAGQWVWRE